jgi:broad specificity phosphatase PhoE
MSSTRTLILVKHAHVQTDPALPATAWPLSAKGREDAARLAQRLGPYAIQTIVTSTEAKAIETGRILADALKVRVEQAQGLHEHDRSNVPMMARSGDFISAVADFFARPSQLVLGRESAHEALARFETAVAAVVAGTTGNLAIVTHGTVLSLLAASHLPGTRAFDLWRRMQLPSYLVFDLPGFALIETVERI